MVWSGVRGLRVESGENADDAVRAAFARLEAVFSDLRWE